MHTHPAPRPRPALLGLAALLLMVSLPGRADFFSKLIEHDVDVISVTDMTEAGKAYAPATPDKPVRYMLVYLGETDFGRDWAGESIPPKPTIKKWLIRSMKTQGYLLADEQHPPEQVFVFGWGMLEGGSARPALKFLGGDKVDLMWEQTQYGGFVDPRVLRRGMIRVGIVGKVWDVAESDLFLGVVRSFTPESMKPGAKLEMLWETRFACPATGLGLDEAMPMLIKAAAMNFGRETDKPISLNATEAFGGRVDYGELKFLGEESRPTKPQDGAEVPAESPK